MGKASLLLALFSATAFLAGCVGMSSVEIGSAPIVTRTNTTVPRATVSACINHELVDLGESVKTFPEIHSGLTQIDIGTMQFMAFHYFYRIDISDVASGSVVDARGSPVMSGLLSQNRLKEVLNTCAPST